MIKEKSKKNNKNRILAMLTMLILVICFVIFNKSSINTNITKNIKNKAGVKSNSIVKSVDLSIVDGVGPFEDNNNPGNDSNDHNNIVRANDSLIYIIQPFTELIDKNNKQYGNIVVEGKLPKQRLISWHKEENNKFAGENITYTEDSNNYYFTYKKDYNELLGGKTGGASVNFPFQVLVSGARNGTKIKPTFTIYMEGNEEAKKQVITPKEVVVSSEPRYEMKLEKSEYVSNYKMVYNGKEGIASNYSLDIKLKNPKDKKGLKGIEYPQGDFLGDLTFKSTFYTGFDSEELLKYNKKRTDITEEYTPEILQYKLNYSEDFGLEKIKENAKEEYSKWCYNPHLPFARSIKKVPEYALINSDSNWTAGDIEIKEKSKNNYLLRFFDYILDEKNIFPTITPSKYAIEEQDGYISVASYIVFQPSVTEEWKENYIKENNINVSVDNFKYNIELETFIKRPRYINHDGKEQTISEDIRKYNLIPYDAGQFDSLIWFTDSNRSISALSPEGENWTTGKSRIYEQNFYLVNYTSIKDALYKPKGITKICKFDSKLFEPSVERYNKNDLDRIDKMYYATKKDGIHWKNDEEMNKATYEDLIYYDTIEEAKKHGEIVALGIQSINVDSKLYTESFNKYVFRTDTKMLVRKDATYGKVGQFASDTYIFFDNTYGGDLKKGEFKPPVRKKEGITLLKHNYIKTVYDENGEQIAGTHGPHHVWSGNSLLVLKAIPGINLETDKNSYNIAANETKIKLKITPTIQIGNEAKTENKKVEVKVILPKDLEYSGNSSKLKGKEIVPKDISKDSEGKTIITYEYDSTLAKADFISNEIILDAKIPVTFGQSRDTKIETNISIKDYTNPPYIDRLSEKSVYVVNLLAQIATKKVKQQVIDYGKKFNYSLKYYNQSQMNYKNVSLFDIMPYNGDKNGTKYNGTYSLENIKVSNGSKIYYTNDTKIREYNAKNYKDSGVSWKEYTGGSLENVTAIYVLTDVAKKSDVEVTYEIVPKNAKAGDVYGNRLYTYVEGQGDTIDTPIYKVAVAKRNIQGLVWEDENINGKIDSNEKKLSGVKLYLKDKDGNALKRIDGSIVESTTTNAKGEYIFEDVPPAKDMYITIDKKDGYEITKKIADNKAGLDYKIKNINTKEAKDLLIYNYLEEIKEMNIGLVKKRKITAKKLWNGGKNRQDINVALYRNIEGKDKEKVKEQTLKTNTGTNKGTTTFDNLDITDDKGNYYTYTVDEINVPTNYNKTISEDGLTITNSYTSPKTKVKILKKWQGGKDRKDIVIELYRKVEGKGLEFVRSQKITTPEGTNEISYTFDSLDKTDENGNEYKYTIDEKKTTENYKKSVDNNNYVVTNTYVSPKTELKVTKKWIGGKERNDIKVQLYRNGKKHLEPVTLKTDKGLNQVSYTFADLDKTDENGNDYTYTIDEIETPKNYVKSIDSKNNTITNTYVSPKVNVVATKKWIGGENARPKTITLALFRNVEGTTEKEKVTEKEITVTKDPELKHEFKNLDETDKNGNKYVYTVEEINVPENYNKEETGLIVTNTYESPKIDIPVSKIYVNGEKKRKDVTIQLLRNKQKIDEVVFKAENGKDTYNHIFADLDKTDKSGKDYSYTVVEKEDVKGFVKRENGLSVTNEYVIPKIDISFVKKWNGGFEGKEKPRFEVQLYRDGNKYLDKVVIEGKDKLEHTWKGLDRTDKNGKEYDYTVKEVLVPKYYKEDIKTIENNETKKKFEITNTFEMPKIDIVGKKIWNYGPDKKPDIEVSLLANGKKVDSIKVLDGKSDFVFKDKDIYDKKGNVIKYDIKENIYAKEYSKKNSLGYDISYTSKVAKKKVTDVEKNREFEITNTYNIPKKSIKGQKVWIGAGDNIPDITLTLFRNGKKYKDIVLKNGQKDYVFEDLDLTDEKGNIYNYYVDEVEVPKGYTKKKTKTGDRIVNVKDEIGKKYIPYAGTKGGMPLIVLLGALAYVVITRKKVTDKRNIGI